MLLRDVGQRTLRLRDHDGIIIVPVVSGPAGTDRKRITKISPGIMSPNAVSIASMDLRTMRVLAIGRRLWGRAGNQFGCFAFPSAPSILVLMDNQPMKSGRPLPSRLPE